MTTAAESPESVLNNIPGWEGAVCTELTGGLTNRTYLVEKESRRAVLKIDATTRDLPYNTRANEGRVQTTAAGRGLASRVLYVDDCIYLTDYSEGRVWSRTDLDNEENLATLAVALKALHSLPLTGRMFDASAAVRSYLSDIDNRDRDMVRRCTEIILSKGMPQNICCCHNDLVAGNVISTPELRFLDWEYACDNDPFFDIATVITHHDLSDQQATLFLNSYFEGDGDRWLGQLRKQTYMYDALHWLWLAGRSRDDENDELLNILAKRLSSESGFDQGTSDLFWAK